MSIQPKLQDNHNFTRKEKSTIFCLLLVVAILVGLSAYFSGKKYGQQISDDITLVLQKKIDSLNLLVTLRDSANAGLKREYGLLKRQDVINDSLFVNNYVKGKAELKYIANLDSAQRQARIDSILKGAKIRK